MISWNWLDIVCLLLFIRGAFEGFTRGFILSAFKTAGVIVALYVGIFYRDFVVDLIKRYFSLESTLSTMFRTPVNPDANSEVLGALGLTSIVDMAMGAIGFFLVFLAVQMVFIILGYFIEGVVRFSHLTLLNRILGFGFGLARSALWIGLISAVITPFLAAWPQGFIARSLEGSYILSHLKFLDFITPVVIKFI